MVVVDAVVVSTGHVADGIGRVDQLAALALVVDDGCMEVQLRIDHDESLNLGAVEAGALLLLDGDGSHTGSHSLDASVLVDLDHLLVA